jgi:hypothetical protein
VHVGEAGTVRRVGTIGTPHTSAPGKQQGLVCTGTCTQTGANGGELAWPSFSKVLRCVKPSVPSPEMGFPKRGTYDSMGATGQVSPCGQTPDGGYSVREPAVRAWGDRLRRSTGARRKKGPEEARLGLDRTTRIIRVAGSRLK